MIFMKKLPRAVPGACLFRKDCPRTAAGLVGRGSVPRCDRGCPIEQVGQAHVGHVRLLAHGEIEAVGRNSTESLYRFVPIVAVAVLGSADPVWREHPLDAYPH